MATEKELSDELYVEVGKVAYSYNVEGDFTVVQGAIGGVSVNVSLKNIHANLIGDDDNVEVTLHWKRPKERDMTLTLLDFIAILSNSRADESVTLPIAEHAVVYRRGWRTSPPREPHTRQTSIRRVLTCPITGFVPIVEKATGLSLAESNDRPYRGASTRGMRSASTGG